MSAKQDDQGRRYVEITVDLPGSLEEVWQAVATGPGYSAWFVPTEIEEREGGAMTFDLGPGMESKGRVTSWSPPHRLTFEEADWCGEAPPLATEVTVETTSGGTCTVRMVHSLFTSQEDWDDQLESMEGGWPPFFEVLRLYLAEFAGLPCRSVRLNGGSSKPIDEAWSSFKAALGFGESASGSDVVYQPVTPTPLRGVDLSRGGHNGSRDVLVVVTEPTTGIALFSGGEWGGQVMLCVQMYFYGAAANDAVERETPLWNAWLAEHFPEA